MTTRYLFTNMLKNKRGVRASYFANTNLEGAPVVSRTESSFLFRWLPDSPPGRNIDVNNFSARWEGRFLAPETGIYRFGLLTGGRARLYIKDKLAIDLWEGPASEFIPVHENTSEIYLEKNQVCDLRMEYYNRSMPHSFMGDLRLGCDLPQPPDLLKKAVAAAGSADVALVFAGLSEEYESEGFDRDTLGLPEEQVTLIRNVAAANPNTVVVLNNGSPVAMSEWLDSVPALVEAWFPGQECGNAIASVLFGEVNPSGKLSDTFPVSLEDTPAYNNYPGSGGKVNYAEGVFVGYRHYDTNGVKPLFPFGHGLSYTTFSYSNVKVNPDYVKPGEKVDVSVDIKNTGPRSGQEVVQLYLRDPVSSQPRPYKELKGFQKVLIGKGRTKTVRFTLSERDLSFFDPASKKWVAELGEFEVLVGSSSRDIRARAFFQLTER